MVQNFSFESNFFLPLKEVGVRPTYQETQSTEPILKSFTGTFLPNFYNWIFSNYEYHEGRYKQPFCFLILC